MGVLLSLSDNRNCRRVVELCRFHFPSLIGQDCLCLLQLLSCALAIRLKCDGFPFAWLPLKKRKEPGIIFSDSISEFIIQSQCTWLMRTSAFPSLDNVSLSMCPR